MDKSRVINFCDLVFDVEKISGAVLNNVFNTELKDKKRMVMGELKHLSPRQKQCIKLILKEGYSYSEIGEKLGIKKSTVQTHISNGVKRLRERLR